MDVEALIAAVEAYHAASAAAGADPANTDLRAVLEQVMTGETAERTTSVLDDYVERGRAERSNPDVPFEVEFSEFTAGRIGDLGFVDACLIDGTLLVEPGGNPDGSDRVVRDSVVSLALTYNLDEVDGEWIVSSLQISQRFDDQIGCA